MDADRVSCRSGRDKGTQGSRALCPVFPFLQVVMKIELWQFKYDFYFENPMFLLRSSIPRFWRMMRFVRRYFSVSYVFSMRRFCSTPTASTIFLLQPPPGFLPSSGETMKIEIRSCPT